MPVSLLTDAERSRLSGFPKEVPAEDLHAFFTLTGPDRAAVPERSAPANRLGFALSLCAVRYLGFCPENLASVPRDVAWYVGQQLMVPAEALAGYPEREQTRTDHLKKVYEHLGYRRPAAEDLRDLFGWLVERAIEHDDATLLVSLLAERMKRERIVRPGASRLEKMVAAARERAGGETFRALSPLLSAGMRADLDALLVPDPDLPGRTRHSWLKEGATSNTPRAILGQLEKLPYLRSLGADKLDLSALNPNRLKFLASLGRRHTNQALKRLGPERRYPVLLAFVADAHAEITDEAMDLFDRLLAQADARSRRELDEFRKGASRAIGEKVRLFREVGEILLDPEVSDAEVRPAVLERVGSAERLGELVEESGSLARPLDDNYYGFFVDHYAHVRRFAPAFLGTFAFRSGRQGEALLEAVAPLAQRRAG
jgi:TnpA family transposase